MEIFMAFLILNMAVVPLKLCYDCLPYRQIVDEVDTVSTSCGIPFYLCGIFQGYINA